MSGCQYAVSATVVPRLPTVVRRSGVPGYWAPLERACERGEGAPFGSDLQGGTVHCHRLDQVLFPFETALLVCH